MKKTNQILLVLSLLMTVLNADIKYWEATLPGGSYAVAVTTITSVSMHDYYVEGVGLVSEVTIDTTGTVTARFYSINASPSGAASAVSEAAQRMANTLKKSGEGIAGVKVADPLTAVVKSYPTTTHAHTVEYRLSEKEEIEALFKSAKSSMITQASGSYKLKE
jgi:hypothetical protein